MSIELEVPQNVRDDMLPGDYVTYEVSIINIPNPNLIEYTKEMEEAFDLLAVCVQVHMGRDEEGAITCLSFAMPSAPHTLGLFCCILGEFEDAADAECLYNEVKAWATTLGTTVDASWSVRWPLDEEEAE